MRPALLLLVLLATPLAAAYGTLEPVNDLGTTLRTQAADPALAALATAGPSPVAFAYANNNTTWTIVVTTGVDPVSTASFQAPAHVGAPARVDGNLTDPTNVSRNGATLLSTDLGAGSLALPQQGAAADASAQSANATAPGYHVHLCVGDAQVGLTDGLARGLRCNGDMDDDGTGDFTEIDQGSNPFGPGALLP